MLREQASGGIGRALTFHHQHWSFWSLAQARKAVERTRCRPLAGEGIAAAGAMPVAIQPDPVQEGLTAAAQSDPLDPEQLGACRIAVTPLGDGTPIQWGWRGVGGWELGLSPGPAAVARQACSGWRLGAGAIAGGERLGPMPPVTAWLQACEEVALHLLAGLAVTPVANAHQQVHPCAAAAQVVLAAALVAEPGAVAVLVIKAVAIPPAAGRTGLVAIAELLSAQPRQRLEDVPPAA